MVFNSCSPRFMIDDGQCNLKYGSYSYKYFTDILQTAIIVVVGYHLPQFAIRFKCLAVISACAMPL